MKELLKLLGLPETATEAEAITAINKMKTDITTATAVVANKSVLDALGLREGVGESEVVGTIMANKQAHDTVATLTQQVNKLTDDLKKKEIADIETMVNAAIAGDEKGSKLTPAQKDWALDYARRDLKGFEVFISKSPYVVLKGEKAGDPPAGGDTALDAAQVQVNKMMGIDNETYKKFGPKKEDK